jgi:ATP-dependent DNA helicase PIF1
MVERAKKVRGAAAAEAGAPAKAGAAADTAAPAGSVDTPPAPPASARTMVVPVAYLEVGRLIKAGRPLIFVSGNAGTGKTTLIRYLRESQSLRSVVVAPTGVAALNAGGSTIHSFFHFPPRIQDARDIKVPSDRRLYQKLELLVVDEVSMLRCDLLDSIDVFLRRSREREEPFGGVQLLFIGDLFQLPPVVPRQEGEILESRGYAGPYFSARFA